MNLANRITIARIFLVPVVILFLLVRYHFWSVTINHQTTTGSEMIAAFVFIVAAASDGLDGYIARKHRLITNFGTFLDPLADKLLVSAVLISLVEMHRLPAWIAILIISRDFSVTGLRLIAAAEGVVLSASRLAKWKTFTQIVAMVALMLNNFPVSYVGFPFDRLMMYVMVVLTVWSGVDYFIKNKQMMEVGS